MFRRQTAISLCKCIDNKALCIAFYSVERSDITGNRFEWDSVKRKLLTSPPPYLKILKILEVKAIEFHRIYSTVHAVRIGHSTGRN